MSWIKNLLCAIALLATSASGLFAHPPVGTQYWPLNNYCEYRTYAITGYYHPSTMALDVWTRTYISGSDARHTFIQLPGAQIPTAANVYTAAGVAAPSNWYGNNDNLAQSVWTPANGGAGFIGESGTFGASWAPGLTVLQPPEPQLPLDITQYTTAITGTTYVTHFDPTTNAVTQDSLTWKFRNMGIGTGPNNTWWWSQFPDQLRTALEERPGAAVGNFVYNYVFAKNMGPIDIWWGTRQSDNTVVNGWEWQVIGCS